MNFFDQLFEGSGLTEEEKARCSLQFSVVVILTLLKNLEPKLSETEKKQIEAWDKEQKYEEVLKFIRSKYSDEEWEVVLKKEIQPLVDSYISEVIDGLRAP